MALVCGEDEFAVKQRAKEIYQQWCEELGGMDHEIIDASVGNSGEALQALWADCAKPCKPFPSSAAARSIWLQNCNFLGDERAASAQAVTEIARRPWLRN